ncbi:hypothetical protein [Streptomyces sp. NRRL F-5135]|uniref:hypothetical protein n=1 Tax=Streptomyces sp. NRRL F-5135 TaxID=1463858 RepID=UPI0004C5020F|nr:hypothetical protein [Streptomyces sp. NRRL F-5135]
MTTPTRPQPVLSRDATVQAAAAALAAAWDTLHRAQLDLLRALSRTPTARARGATQRRRDAVRRFLDALAAFDRTARAVTERWAARDLPLLYRDGAVASLKRAVHSVQQHARPFEWTDRHQSTITALSTQYYADLTARIQEAVRRAQAFARNAQDQARTPEGIDRKQLLAAHPLDRVVYADQSKHTVRHWATAALKEQATTAANTAALLYGTDDLGARWFECTDGPECGFAGHPDTDHADGTIRSADDAAMFPTSHFGCIRQWTPRPDLNYAPNLSSGDQV